MGLKEVGYHGTVKPYANSIIENQHFNESIKPNEWLGHGVYFWDNSETAIWWAKIQEQRKKEKSVVLAANLSYKEFELLNLDKVNEAKKLNEFYKQFIMQLESEGKLGIDFSSREDKRRCFTIELYKKFHPEIKIIAYTFDVVPKTGEATRLLFIGKQKQYCVVDHAIISDIREYREKE